MLLFPPHEGITACQINTRFPGRLLDTFPLNFEPLLMLDHWVSSVIEFNEPFDRRYQQSR